MSRYVGIDPGKKGAVAVLDGYGELVAIHDMPVVGNQVSGRMLIDLIDVAHIGTMPGESSDFVTAVVEKAQSYPKQGIASAFDFGKSYGIVLGALSAVSIRTEDVAPNRWKKAMRLTADKEACRRRAIERWPNHVEFFKRKKDADRAEAALIALWFIQHGDGR